MRRDKNFFTPTVAQMVLEGYLDRPSQTKRKIQGRVMIPGYSTLSSKTLVSHVPLFKEVIRTGLSVGLVLHMLMSRRERGNNVLGENICRT